MARREDKLKALKEEIEGQGGRAQVELFDVMKDEEIIR